MAAIARVPGTPIELDGVEYILPPIALGALEQRGKVFADLQAGIAGIEQFSQVIDLVHVALLRNYPDLTRETVANGLDMSNMQAAFAALVKTSGLVREGEVRAGASGEPQATTG